MDEVHEQSYSHNQQYSDLKEVIDQGLQKLSEQQRTVIMLRDYEGYDYKSIGDIMDMSEAQVKINIYRGRQALKKYFKDLQLVI